MKTIIAFVILIGLQPISAQSITLSSGASLYIPQGADICAGTYGNITGGTVTGEGTQCGDKPVLIDKESTLPVRFAVYQNYPNPFNPSTIIRYSLPSECKVMIKLYNILGQEIRQLVNTTESAGIHYISFNAGNLASGTYLCRITANTTDSEREFVDTKKLMLIK